MIKSALLLLLASLAGFGAGRWFADSRGVVPPPSVGFTPDAGTVDVNATAEDGKPFTSEAEAAGAFFSAHQNPNKLRRGYELHRVIDRLDAAQIRALADRVANLGFGDISYLLEPLLARWVVLDREGAAAWARPIIERNFVDSRGVDAVVCSAWCAADPEAALALALERPFADGSRILVENAMQTLAGDQPDAQVRRLAALPEGKLRESALAACLKVWAARSPSQAFAQLDLLIPGATQDRTRRQILAIWAAQDAPSALAALSASLSSVPPETIGETLRLVISPAARNDPEGVCSLLLSFPAEQRAEALAEGLQQWAEQDAIGALTWGHAHGAALDTRSDPRSGRTPMFQAMVANPPATLAFVQSLPHGPERDRLLKAALHGSQDGTGREFLLDLPSADQPGAADWLAMVFMGKNAEGAIEWAQTLPPGTTREAALRGLFGSGFPMPPERAESLVSTLPAGPDRDAALSSAAESYAFSVQNQALEFASRISEPSLRERTFRKIAASWLFMQPTAAEAWLVTTKEISPAANAIMLRRLAESRGEQ